MVRVKITKKLKFYWRTFLRMIRQMLESNENPRNCFLSEPLTAQNEFLRAIIFRHYCRYEGRAIVSKNSCNDYEKLSPPRYQVDLWIYATYEELVLAAAFRDNGKLLPGNTPVGPTHPAPEHERIRRKRRIIRRKDLRRKWNKKTHEPNIMRRCKRNKNVNIYCWVVRTLRGGKKHDFLKSSVSPRLFG